MYLGTLWTFDLTAKQTVLSSVLIAFTLIAYIWQEEVRKRRRGTLGGAVPIVDDAHYILRHLGRSPYNVDAAKLMTKGYELYGKKGKLWSFWGPHDDLMIALPPDYLDDIKATSNQTLSFIRAADEAFRFRFHARMTGDQHIGMIRFDLGKRMKELHGMIVEQADHALDVINSSIEEKGEIIINAYELCTDICNRVVTTTTFGPQFLVNDDYLIQVKAYALAVQVFAFCYHLVPSTFKSLFWFVSPVGIYLRQKMQRLRHVHINAISSRLALIDGEKSTTLPYMLDMLLERRRIAGRLSRITDGQISSAEHDEIQICAEELAVLSFEATGPVSMLVLQLIYNLLSHPEFFDILRDEISSSLKANYQQWSETTIEHLPRLDSFIKETLRVNSVLMCTVTRLVLQPFTLENGLVIQPGTMITMPNRAINFDSDHYQNAGIFDGNRFYDSQTRTSAKPTTTTKEYLNFGYGSQSCPGRFLGVKIAKIVLVKLLLKYDVQIRERDRTKQFNLNQFGQYMPNMKIDLELTPRTKF